MGFAGVQSMNESDEGREFSLSLRDRMIRRRGERREDEVSSGDDRRRRRREVKEQQVTGRPGQAPHSSQTGSKTSAHLMEINKELITWRLSHGALPPSNSTTHGSLPISFQI